MKYFVFFIHIYFCTFCFAESEEFTFDASPEFQLENEWDESIDSSDLLTLDGISHQQGQHIVNIARTWVGTPYQLGGTSKGPSGGTDCSHSTHEIFKEAGFGYRYSPSSSFANNPQFSRVVGAPQVGDVGLYNDHMAIFDPNAGNGMNVWTARRTGGPAYGAALSSWFGTPRWFRYNPK